MALVSGPLLSLDASGKVAGALVFSKWKGRPVVRQLVKPANPKTGAQKGGRAMFAFLSSAWADLSAPEKASWQALADAAVVSPFNAYQGYNMDEWTQFTSPYTNPSNTGETPPTMGALTAEGGVRQVTISAVITTPEDMWGMAVAISVTTGFTPAKADVAKIVAYAASPIVTVISPLEPGTYFARVAGFTGDGQMTNWVAQDEFTVT